ncbi:MAG: TonB-dependent receptor plug domain-containing protein, partial [Aliifodinibius sp.]|nr:TonB-dependent receptor plug domain-containing protein [Fodinibius sp.]NIX00611.1 TonB-dependent receptor plug domain-containing protein [Phycisphaerae bacterium]NIY23549.1 TonB-dependent receptor plug domain-containing protein [Fodinibius sp.]
TDAVTGEQLPGVNVVIQGTSSGTTTGMDGSYSINVDGPGVVLVFSYVGYEAQTISITSSHISGGLDIELQEDVALLEELVVVGFGTQERADVTGAVSSIQGAEVEERPLTNPALALQGVTPGLQIQYGGGQPGEENTIARIRGTGTLNNA